MDRDRNLLFGVFAVQLRRVTPAQLVEAAALWATDPARGLGERLVELGHLAEADRAFVDDVVSRAIDDHGGDAGATLTAFGGDEQVYASFRGSIVPTSDGGITKPNENVTVLGQAIDDSGAGVQEAPGRYTHMGEFGRGGMGRVLLVHDAHLTRDIAMKELLPELSGSTGGSPTPVRNTLPMVARFLQEARITGQLEHPSIVPVYELGYRPNGTLYYTMKLVRGKTLSAAINEAKNLQDRLELLPHFIDLCNAIAYAHSRGVIHRDIKPANVMVGDFGETVVLDWGLAKAKGKIDVHADGLTETLSALRAGEPDAAHKTRYGQALGTPAYMPPEQALGKLDEIDERSDVYALGAVLYELLTGEVPFRGNSVADTLRRVLQEEAESVLERTPAAPTELASVCERAMAKDRKERFATAADLAEEINRFQSGAMLQSHEYGLGEHLKRWAVKHKAALATAAVALIVILAAFGFSYVSILRANEAEREQRIAAEQAQRMADVERAKAIEARDLARANEAAALESKRRHAIRSVLEIEEPHHNGSRVAFVVGNDAYVELPHLAGAANDARSVADTLRESGFEVMQTTDAARIDIEEGLRALTDKAHRAEIALFFFAGQGGAHDNQTRLLGTDAVLKDPDKAYLQGIPASRILSELQTTDAALKVVVLDTCRSHVENDVSQYAEILPDEGVILLYSTGPGDVAFEREIDGKTRGVFSYWFEKYLRTPGLEFREAILATRVKVAQETDYEQVPWVHDSSTQLFYMHAENNAE